MRGTWRVPFALLTAALLGATAPVRGDFLGQHVVVANRGSGSISVIDVATSGVSTFALPAAANAPEPMYVFHSTQNDVVFVGDRGNNRVVAFDARTYGVVASGIAAGAGIFHMWGSPAANQLWVNNENSRTITVIDMLTFGNLGTIATPGGLGPNARPHDVILDPGGAFAFVSLIGADGPNDFVIKYSTATLAEVDRQAVGKDPHLGLTSRDGLLYVPSQNSDQFARLDRATLDPVGAPLPLPRAHGITPTADGQLLYLTSFPGAAPDTGLNGLHVFDTITGSFLNTVTAPNAGSGPHNVVLSSDNSRLYITHSGATSTVVSVFDLTAAGRSNPAFLSNLTVGLNPFGIAAVAAIPEPSSLATLLMGILGVAGLRRLRPRPRA